MKRVIIGVCALVLTALVFILGAKYGATRAMESAYLIESSDYHYGISYFDMAIDYYYAL